MKLSTIDSDNEYSLITTAANDSSFNFPHGNFKKIVFHDEITPSEIIRYFINRLCGEKSSAEIILNKIISKYHFDVWFCPFLNLEPRPVKIPSIVTIPDLQHEYYPENFSGKELFLRKGYVKPSGEMATEIITLSDFSKKCFIEKLGLDPEKIHVIPLSADDRFSKPLENVDDTMKKYDLPDEYFLYPANGWPHKNHLALIEGFSFYKKSFNTPLHLVLTGSGLKDSGAIKDRITHNHLQEYVHILGYVDDEDLPGLYKNANALVFPSLFEGFGIPLVEAMAMGCPIIASNTTSIPEVAGDAAYFFDPTNPQSICDAMRRIVDDNSLRENSIRNGKNRAAHYSYDTVARRHLEIFASAFSKAKEVERGYHHRKNGESSTAAPRHNFHTRV